VSICSYRAANPAVACSSQRIRHRASRHHMLDIVANHYSHGECRIVGCL
jgi:hypothetical protein